MFETPLLRRIAIGKLTGLAIAALGALAFPGFYAFVGWDVFLGVALYYITLGAMIGVFGVMTDLPVVPFKFTWWWRGPWIAGFMTLALVLMFGDALARVFETYAGGSYGLMTSPFAFVVEAVIFGLIADFLATRFAGDGAGTLR